MVGRLADAAVANANATKKATFCPMRTDSARRNKQSDNYHRGLSNLDFFLGIALSLANNVGVNIVGK